MTLVEVAVQWLRTGIYAGAVTLCACGGGGGSVDASGNPGPVTPPPAAFIPDRTFYVADTGLDTNAGTATAPWATLPHAASRVQAGDLVLVANGEYTGFTTAAGGSALKPIMFKANGNSVVISSAAAQDNVTIEHDYVILDGFQVRAARRGGIAVIEATGVIVRNNTVGPNAVWGIFTGFAPAVQIINNEAFGSAREHGIYVSNSRIADDNPVIRGNTVYGNVGNGIQLNGDCYAGGDGVIGGALIENNVVHNNGAKGLSLISIAASRVQNNLIYENGGAGGIHLTDEIDSAGFCGNPTISTVIVNNTIHESDGTAGIRITDGAQGNTLFNNAVIGTNGIVDEVGGNASAHNFTGTDAVATFIAPGSADYRLTATSPARNVGVASYDGVAAPTVDGQALPRPQGGGMDAGAYERD